ncbi:MAG: hypothetical protein WKF45_04685 [Ilumatobacteraceae bacterium]
MLVVASIVVPGVVDPVGRVVAPGSVVSTAVVIGGSDSDGANSWSLPLTATAAPAPAANSTAHAVPIRA